MINNPSKYQYAIFDALLNTDKNIVIQATAGAGKTETLVTCSELLPNNLSMAFLAFNKSIVEHLKNKLPPTVVCKTAHSFGLTALSEYYRIGFKLNVFKSLSFIAEKLKEKPALNEKEKNSLQFIMMDVIGMVRMNCTSYDIESISSLCKYYDFDLSEEEISDLIEIMYKIDFYNKSFSKNKNNIDFNEMISLSLDPKVKFPQFDVVMVDEVQDLNQAQLYLVEKLIKPNGRIIAVGDERQSIYGFSGAYGQSFEYFAKRSNTIKLPLSISYRCSRAIVENAAKIYPEIEVYDKNPQGEVRYGDIDEIRANDFVICRNNRPLIQLYFSLLEKNIPSTLIGKDLEVGLNKLLAKIINCDVEKGLEKLDELLKKLKEDLEAKGVKNVNNNEKYIKQYEQNKIIEILSKGLSRMNQVEEKIKELFKEGKKDAVRLSSIHRAKGLEAERVFLITHFEGKKLIPSSYAIQPHELVAETNISFVAATRAKNELIYVKL